MLAIDHMSATAWPPLSRMTPLGRPVVPEVYKTYSGSVAWTATHSTGCAHSITVAQSTSRSSIMAALAWGRW